MAPAKPGTAVPDQSSDGAKTVAMPALQNSVSPDAVDPGRPKKLGAISPPLAWPSANIQEIARPARPRIPLEQSTGATPPRPTAATVTQPVEMPAVRARRPNPMASTIPVLLKFIHAQRDVVLRTVSRTRENGALALSRAGAKFRGLKSSGQEWYQAWQVRRRVRQTEVTSTDHVGETPMQSEIPPPTPSSPVSRWQDSATVLKTREALYRVLAWTRASGDRSIQLARQLSDFKVKVRLDGGRFAALQALFSNSYRNQRLRFAQRDSRLWTSMAMAALSALLALGVFSALRRYAPETTPSKVSASTPAVPAIQPPAMILPVPKPSPSSSKTTARAPATVVHPASLLTSAPKPSTSKPVRKRAHHNDDEDYVAKDTYVYYGPNGKRSH